MSPRDTINLILLATGVGMLIWLVSLLAQFRSGRVRRDADTAVNQDTHIPAQKTADAGEENALLILGLGMLSAIPGALLSYCVFKEMNVDGWEILSTPPRHPIAILFVRAECESDDFDVFVQGKNGELYVCSYTNPLCSLSTTPADQIAAMAASAPYFDAEPEDYPSPPNHRIADVCQFSGVPSCEVISTVALLEDGSLWFKPGAPYDVAFLAKCLVCALGACAGGAFGLIAGVGLVWKQGRRSRT